MFQQQSQSLHCCTSVQLWSYLSQDEAGGRGAAVGSLQSTAPGVRPSVGLREAAKHTLVFHVILKADVVIALSHGAPS